MADDQTTRIDQRLDEQPDKEGKPSIVLIYGDELGKRYIIDPELTLGRSNTNDIVLRVDNVSRHHALIQHSDGVTKLADRGSTNGSFINDDMVLGETALAHGDLIKIGNVLFRYISGDNAEAHYHEEIYRLAITDGLTGLNNRRFFEDFMDREVARSDRSGAQLSMILFDIDEFKSLNDSRGHLFGDYVLRELAGAVTRRVRREQLLARFGGDEFVLVLPDVTLSRAQAFAERIRTLAERRMFESEGKKGTLTLSLGVATLVPGMTRGELVELADRSLYAAKEAGRNQVVALQKDPSGEVSAEAAVALSENGRDSSLGDESTGA